MTVAICCPTDEGVVIGADSATTVQPEGAKGVEIAIRHFNHAQKLFEVGCECSYGPLMIATWGLGAIGHVSHRSLVAEFADLIEKAPHQIKPVQDIAALWNDHVWSRFSGGLASQIARAKSLKAKTLSPAEIKELTDLTAKPTLEASESTRKSELESKRRTDHEEIEFRALGNLHGGYFLAGRRREDRTTFAYQIDYHWDSDKRPVTTIPIGSVNIQGVNLFILRLLNGIDPRLLNKIAQDSRWNGTDKDLEQLVKEFQYYHGYSLPLRDAVEMVYSFVYCTIKALRFSRLAPICGGPIEIATVTTDRGFRWVCHKDLDVAIHQALFNETRHV